MCNVQCTAQEICTYQHVWLRLSWLCSVTYTVRNILIHVNIGAFWRWFGGCGWVEYGRGGGCGRVSVWGGGVGWNTTTQTTYRPPPLQCSRVNSRCEKLQILGIFVIYGSFTIVVKTSHFEHCLLHWCLVRSVWCHGITWLTYWLNDTFEFLLPVEHFIMIVYLISFCICVALSVYIPKTVLVY